MTTGPGQAASTTRCIYTREPLISGDDLLKPSREHIVPLSLGGSNGLTTDEVTAAANSRAGREIDDAVASQLPFLMLRHRYGLQGNRKTIPSVKLKGAFAGIDEAPAAMEISAAGEVAFEFLKEQTVSGTVAMGGQIVTYGTTEERLRFLLRKRLEQVRQSKVDLHTPLGRITDEEDIEIALMLVDRQQGREFQASHKIDLDAFDFAYSRLMIKIGLGLGHRVLSSFWTFSDHGDRLRQQLWAAPTDPSPTRRWGSIYPDTNHPLASFLGVEEDHHVMAVLPSGTTTTVAIIALFGGAFGVATVDLGGNNLRLFEIGGDAIMGGCVFKIPIDADVKKRRLQSRLFRHLADDAATMGFKLSEGVPVPISPRRG